jgi:hypothetical protein
MHTQIISKTPLNADEVAAALAAIACCMHAEPQPEHAGDWQWRVTSALTTQGIVTVRAPIKPSWAHIERLRRAGHGVSGITGL